MCGGLCSACWKYMRITIPLNLDNIGIFLASFLLYHYIVIFAIPICKIQPNKQKWVAPYGTTQQDHFMADSLFHSIRLLNIFWHDIGGKASVYSIWIATLGNSSGIYTKVGRAAVAAKYCIVIKPYAKSTTSPGLTINTLLAVLASTSALKALTSWAMGGQVL